MLLLAAATTAVVLKAYAKGLAGGSDWSYWKLAAQAEQAWENVNLGYLPVFSLLVRPFVALGEPLGLLLFILLAVSCSMATFHVLWREMSTGISGMPRHYGVRHLLWLSGPFLVAVRNNQVTVQMMALLVLGLVLLMRKHSLPGSAVLGLSAFLKPLTLTLALYLLLKRRWQSAAVLGATVLAGSLLLTTLDVGWTKGVERHVAWPQRLLCLTASESAVDSSNSSVFSSDTNQSVIAWIVRGESWLGPSTSAAIRGAVFWLSLLAVCWVVIRRGIRHRPTWDECALWLAWTTFAAPFGRYYYSVLLIPTWIVLLQSTASGRRCNSPTRALAVALPLLAWGGRTTGVFALLATTSFLLILHRMACAPIAGRKTRELWHRPIEALAHPCEPSHRSRLPKESVWLPRPGDLAQSLTARPATSPMRNKMTNGPPIRAILAGAECPRR